MADASPAELLYRSAFQAARVSRSTVMLATEDDWLVERPSPSIWSRLRLDRDRVAIESLREAARVGPGRVPLSDNDAERQRQLAAFGWILRRGEALAKRHRGARKIRWAVEIGLDLVMACRDLQRAGEDDEILYALEEEIRVLRWLRDVAQSKRVDSATATLLVDRANLVLVSDESVATDDPESLEGIRRRTRDTLASATLATFCLTAYQREHGFYPEQLSVACEAYGVATPTDPFDGEGGALRLRRANGELLRGQAIDRHRRRWLALPAYRTRWRQPLVYSVAADQTDDRAATVWNGRPGGRGDWVFPLMAEKRPRHWLQLDLRKMLIACLLVACWMAFRQSSVAQLRRTMRVMEESGGTAQAVGPDSSLDRWAVTSMIGKWIGGEKKTMVESLYFGDQTPIRVTLGKLPELPDVNSISLQAANIVSGDIAALNRFENLRSLDLSYTVFPFEDAANFSAFPQLESLDLSDMGAGNDLLLNLPLMPRLKELQIECNAFDGDGFVGFAAKFPALESLTIYSNMLDERAIREIGQLTRLTYLDLDGTNISADEIVFLKNLTNLETLDLQRNPIQDNALTHLAGMNRLTELRLNETKVTERGVAKLKQLPLQSLQFDDCPVRDPVVDTLVSIKTLTSVSLDNTLVTAAAASRLRKVKPSLYVSQSFEPLRHLGRKGVQEMFGGGDEKSDFEHALLNFFQESLGQDEGLEDLFDDSNPF